MGGGRRCKHWPPGAGDPRYATGYRVYVWRALLTIGEENRAAQTQQYGEGEQSFVARFTRDGKAWGTGRGVSRTGLRGGGPKVANVK